MVCNCNYHTKPPRGKSKIEITRNINESIFPDVKIDGQVIPVKAFELVWDVSNNRIGSVRLDMHLKDCQIDFNGIVSINGFPISDKIGKQIYEQLKIKYEEPNFFQDEVK